MPSITLTANGSTITIDRPQYGYNAEIHMPIHTSRYHPFGYGFFDCGGNAKTFDYRICNTARWVLPADQKAALNDFLRDSAKGRNQNITISLGATSTGFYPGGPDLGDVGDWVFRVYERQQGGMTLSPYRHFQDEISLVLVTAPTAQALPSGVDQGSLQIGSITGLMFPQQGYNPEAKYNASTGFSRSGVPFGIDGTMASDSWESAWTQRCNNGKAASLVDFLIGTLGRANEITVITDYFNYIFGSDRGSNGAYICRFLGSSKTKNEIIIKCQHNRFNEWEIPLSFWMQDKVKMVLEFKNGISEIEEGIYEL